MSLTVDQTIGVVGAGTMGIGIAQVAASAGHRVLIFDEIESSLEKALQHMQVSLEKLVSKGRISQQQCQKTLARVNVVQSLTEFAQADLVIEAIIEDLVSKKNLFAQLETFCRADTIFASNTSSLSITAIAADLKHPERMVGMHFFNPAPVMKLVEVVRALTTQDSIADKVYATAMTWGKQAVLVRSTPGFVVNRIARPYYAEALRILEEGASNIATIDAIMCDSGGFVMGPFALMDLIGLDVNYAVTQSVFNSYYGDGRFRPSLVQKELIEAGFLGRKSGRGFYHYEDGKQQQEKPEYIVHQADSDYRPSQVIFSKHSAIQKVLQTIAQTHQIATKIEEDGSTDLTIQVGTAMMCLTDGRLASQRAIDDKKSNLIVFDLAYDYTQSTRIVLAPSDQATDQSLKEAIGFWQAIGKEVSVIDDIAGLCVMRTLAMLVNEGADAVNQGVCTVAAVDIAMRAGLNYPRGPMEWADTIGLDQIANCLSNLFTLYGDERYRLSPMISRLIASDSPLYEFNRKIS